MKTPKVTDVFKFDSCNPGYDEVQDKLCELQLKGWHKLKYEPGFQYTGGRDPYDTDYRVGAKITGVRTATHTDAKKFIHEGKTKIKKMRTEIEEVCAEIDKYTDRQKETIKSIEEEIAKETRMVKKMETYVKK